MAVKEYNLYNAQSGSDTNSLRLQFLREALIPNFIGENGTVVTDHDADAAIYSYWSVDPDSEDGLFKQVYTIRDENEHDILRLCQNIVKVSSSGTWGPTDVPTKFFIAQDYAVKAGASVITNAWDRCTYRSNDGSGDPESWRTGYSATKGAAIRSYGTSRSSNANTGLGLLWQYFCKTNNGKFCWIINGLSSISYNDNDFTLKYNCLKNLYTVAVGDSKDENWMQRVNLTTYSTIKDTQTVLCPIPTHPDSGVSSYADGVYILLASPFRNIIGEVQIDGKPYWTNGYIAIADY